MRRTCNKVSIPPDGSRATPITAYDLSRLRALIEEARRLDPICDRYLENPDEELSRARVVAPSEVPADVITMNSRVRMIDLDTMEEMVHTLVFPGDADIAHPKISVLAPIGTARLGYRVGDVFKWKVPDGVRRIQVKELLYQPEASGDYHM